MLVAVAICSAGEWTEGPMILHTRLQEYSRHEPHVDIEVSLPRGEDTLLMIVQLCRDNQKRHFHNPAHAMIKIHHLTSGYAKTQENSTHAMLS